MKRLLIYASDNEFPLMNMLEKCKKSCQPGTVRYNNQGAVYI